MSATPEGGAAMRECEGCAAGAIRKPLLIRAVGARLEIGDARQAATVRLAGPVTLAAHGETITLRNPVRVAVAINTTGSGRHPARGELRGARGGQ